jgi:rhodanese-related sulfurtransferase
MSTLANLVEEAATTVDSLSADQFAAEADQPLTVVVDVREADERVQTGSIAKAIHIPRGLLEFRADPTNAGHDPRLRPDDRVLLYCDDGARATLAAASLRNLGYNSVALLRGGLGAWDEARLPLVGRTSSPY